MKPKDIFGLAVRLLGLVFLYLGLKAVLPVLDLETIESADKSDIINMIFPVAFNLIVAWWLLGGGLLTRRAYPEEPKISDRSRSQTGREAAPTHSIEPQELTGMNSIERKLAPLVEKPKEHGTRMDAGILQ
jgi:hypothetical protein